MTHEIRMELLEEAEGERNEARAAFNAATVGTKKWRKAENDLNWWIGRVAFPANPKIEEGRQA